MAIVKRTITAYRCDRCGHTWIPRRAKLPKVCPVCKRAAWNVGKP